MLAARHLTQLRPRQHFALLGLMQDVEHKLAIVGVLRSGV
jgi:hypothetical protein